MLYLYEAKKEIWVSFDTQLKELCTEFTLNFLNCGTIWQRIEQAPAAQIIFTHTILYSNLSLAPMHCTGEFEYVIWCCKRRKQELLAHDFCEVEHVEQFATLKRGVAIMGAIFGRNAVS